MRLRIALILLVASLFVTPIASAAKSYGADRYDVDVVIVDDGSLLVTETVVFRFAGGPFTTVFRDLNDDETDGISDIVAAMDGRTLTPGKGEGQVDVAYGQDVNVTWHFAPSSDATHTFVLSYRMLGVIRQQGDADVFSFRALPSDHDYQIASSTVRVSYPKTANLIGEAQVARGSAEIETGPQQVTFRSSDVKRDRTLQVALRFEPGSLISEPPQWQAARTSHDHLAPYWLGLALAIIGAGLGALARFWRGAARRVSPLPVGELRVMRPPSDLPPALAGMIKDDAAEAQWSHGLGTMLDLARRGVLTIEELAKRSWGQREFSIQLVTMPADLRPHESALLRLFFAEKGSADIAAGATVTMSKLRSRIAAHWNDFAKPLQGEMRSAALFAPERERTRRNVIVAAWIVLVAGALAFVPAIPLIGRFGSWVMIIPFSILAVSVAAFLAGGSFSPLADKAALERPRWEAFARYLKDVAKGKEPFVGAQLLEQYLPYAASMGLAGDWAKLFKQRENEDVLAWFRPLAGAADGGSASFVAMVAASSSVGHSGGAAGGAGGGASGAH